LLENFKYCFMDDILTWIYIIAIALAGGFIIYIFGAIPMMINQKKQVVAYRKLASLYGFEIKNDKVKFFPTWPTIYLKSASCLRNEGLKCMTDGVSADMSTVSVAVATVRSGVSSIATGGM
jgi:hypothetical protein